ncbi:MAG: glutamate-cysteine ligase family protein, partial [Hyphomicrobiales bacterium]
HTFRDFMEGRLDTVLPGQRPTVGDWNNHLSTLFPDVRLKRYIEMRGADGGPWRRICALPAFWTGLLYDAESLAAAADLVADWTEAERLQLRDDVPKLALRAPFRDHTVREIARDVVALSRAGLARRAKLNSAGFDETGFLAPVEESLAIGETPADRMLRRYHTDWNWEIDPVFEEYAY